MGEDAIDELCVYMELLQLPVFRSLVTGVCPSLDPIFAAEDSLWLPFVLDLLMRIAVQTPSIAEQRSLADWPTARASLLAFARAQPMTASKLLAAPSHEQAVAPSLFMFSDHTCACRKGHHYCTPFGDLGWPRSGLHAQSFSPSWPH